MVPSSDADEMVELSIPSNQDWKMVSNVTFDFTAMHASKIAVATKDGMEPFATFMVGPDAEPVVLSVPRAARTLYVSYETASGKWSGKTLPVAERIPFAIPNDSNDYTELQTTRAAALNGLVVYPDSDLWGTLMFEDLWPGYGDYDFNDLVMNYSIREMLAGQNSVGSVLVTLRTKAVGGSLPFDFYVGIPAVRADEISRIEVSTVENAAGSVTVKAMTEGAYAGGGAVFEVKGMRDNAHKPSGAIYLNTEKGYEMVETDLVWVTFEVTFKNPVKAAFLTLDTFDFFIGRTDQLGRRIEIHMGDYKPSAGAWTDYYAIREGNLNIGKSMKPYFSNSNLVWGLNIPYDVKHGYEAGNFLEAYPYFKTWAQSGGLLDQDWYQKGIDEMLVQNKR